MCMKFPPLPYKTRMMEFLLANLNVEFHPFSCIMREINQDAWRCVGNSFSLESLSVLCYTFVFMLTHEVPAHLDLDFLHT